MYFISSLSFALVSSLVASIVSASPIIPCGRNAFRSAVQSNMIEAFGLINNASSTLAASCESSSSQPSLTCSAKDAIQKDVESAVNLLFQTANLYSEEFNLPSGHCTFPPPECLTCETFSQAIAFINKLFGDYEQAWNEFDSSDPGCKQKAENLLEVVFRIDCNTRYVLQGVSPCVCSGGSSSSGLMEILEFIRDVAAENCRRNRMC